MVIDMVMNERAFLMNERPLKRSKRITADYNNCYDYDFFTFPAAADFNSGGAPFRLTIHRFLLSHARPIFPSSWEINLRIAAHPDDVVTLYVAEEDVTKSYTSVYCDQCRVVGWSRHPVCNKRYHFIIRRDNSSSASVDKISDTSCSPIVDGHQKKAAASSTCTSCNNNNNVLHFSCNCCNYGVGLEKWLYHQLEDSTHILHGVVHSNGYGHLLTLNGHAGGSNFLSGSDIMNFWDRLCQTLSVRKITVMDLSRKYGIEYRLIHSIAKGHPWYGNWGYEFGAASYALTRDAYNEAISTLSNMPLSLFSYNPRRPRTRLQNVIAFYQSISESKLKTVRDLFSFMLRFVDKTRKSAMIGQCVNPKVSDSKTFCNWSMEDVERVEQVAIKVLQVAASSNANWVSKRALKGSLSSKKTPQDLLEHCLQNMGGKLAGNGMMVNTRCNHNTMAVEFRLEQFDSMYSKAFSNSNRPSKEDIVNDLKFLYDSILNPSTMVNYTPRSTREMAIASATKILDCKQFIKKYEPDNMDALNPLTIRILCHVEHEDHHKDDPTPPPELMVLPKTFTVGDLKREATEAFREMYVIFKGFEVDKVLEFGPLDDAVTLKLLIGSRGRVRVKGQNHGAHGLGRFRMERGTENWIVDCICGAKDDDGERMLACDDCGTWQHTRCAGIEIHEEVPTEFVCDSCLESINDDPEEDEEKPNVKDVVVASITCTREAVVTNFRKPGP